MKTKDPAVARKDPAVARWFAIAKHGDQMYGQHPYSYHLEMAVAELKAHILPLPALAFYDHDVIECATWLHDVVEDTGTSPDEMYGLFVPQVVQLVQSVTDGPGKNRNEKKAHVYAAIRATGPAALAVKLADRLANSKACGTAKDVTPMLQMYRKEQGTFEHELFHMTNFRAFLPAWQQVRRYLGMEPIKS